MKHTCHWPGCKVEVAPKFWGCWAHWRSLPKRFQDRIWKAYRRGQEVTKTPSAEYVQVAKEVQAWIAEQIKCQQALARNEKLDTGPRSAGETE
jgi:hypothetical protein